MTPSKIDEVHTDTIEHEVKAEQIRLLYHHGISIQVLGVFTAMIAAVMFREVADTTMIAVWFVGMIVVTTGRLYLNYRFSQIPAEQTEIAIWGNYYIAGTFISGTAWGTLALFFEPSWPVPHQIILFVIFTGIIASAYNANSSLFMAFPAFYLPPVLLLMLVMLRGGEAFFELETLFVLYIIMMAFSSKKYHQRLAHSLRLQIVNRSLAQDLEISNRRLKQLAEIDDLTQLYNRRSMDRCLKDEWERHVRSAKSLSLLFIDIDFFKQYNDAYGHHEGDQCLICVATVLQNYAQRATDMAVRFGGEEFAIILPETDQANAINLAENIRQAIEDLNIFHSGSKIANVLTVSIGIATTVPTQSAQLESFKIEADKALYKAKAQGRNRIAYM